jgi:hypothetical protein
VAAELPAEFDQKAANALANLVHRVISDPGLRHTFRNDPVGTAQAAGVDITPIPERLIGMLASLSVQELRLLTELNQTFGDEGLHVKLEDTTMMVL